MAKRRKKRRVSSYKKVHEGKAILREVEDDNNAAKMLSSLFKEDVGEAIDLHDSFNTFSKKHNIKNSSKRGKK